MPVTAVIPARGGSKGVPHKNLWPLAGRPLIVWSIDVAQAAKAIDRVIVSTDDAEIAQIARESGSEVPFLRPSHLAADDVHSIHAVLHALDWLEQHENRLPEIVVMLLPTSPFRLSSHVDKAVDLFREHRPPAVISVCEHRKPLHSLRWIRGQRIVPVLELHEPNRQRQDVEPLYGVNGSIYVSTPQALRASGTFHMAEAMPMVMPELNSIDINTLEDCKLADALAATLFATA